MEGVATQLAGFVKEDKDIETAVAGVEPLLKSFQSEADKRAAAGKSEAERLKAEIAEAKKKLEELAVKPPAKPGEQGGDDVPAWAKGILDKVGALELGLNNFNAERNSQTLTQKLTGLLAEKKVPESYYKAGVVGRTFKDEAEVQAVAEQFTAGYEAFKQEASNIGFSYTEPPQNGAAPKNDASEIASMIEQGTKTIIEQSKK
jgi:hypothetical protein